LYDRSFNEFKIVLAFNPLFIIISWITNALIFSIISSGLLTLALFCSKSPRKYEIKEKPRLGFFILMIFCFNFSILDLMHLLMLQQSYCKL
jgi:hypothetical protein